MERVGVDQPIYTVADIERLARVSRGAARRWFALTGHPSEHRGSFLDLVEFLVVRQLRHRGFSYRLIRDIALATQHRLKIERPLASAQFKLSGRDIFVQVGDQLVEVGRRRGQAAWLEVLKPFLETLDYSNGLAVAWWPLGKDRRVKVSPDIGFGFPVVAGTGVRTEIVRERFSAGDAIEVIADDFGLDVGAVEDALRFELRESA